jgi:hypothetical protein
MGSTAGWMPLSSLPLLLCLHVGALGPYDRNVLSLGGLQADTDASNTVINIGGRQLRSTGI